MSHTRGHLAPFVAVAVYVAHGHPTQMVQHDWGVGHKSAAQLLLSCVSVYLHHHQQ